MNSKVHATVFEKVKFIGLTYSISLLLWFAIGFSSFAFVPKMAEFDWVRTIAHFDIYKIAVIFIACLAVGNFLDKLPQYFNFPVLIFRVLAVWLVLVCINTRWNIESSSVLFFNEILHIGILTLVAQVFRILVMAGYGNLNIRYLELIKKVGGIVVFLLIAVVLVYAVFTISERSDNHSDVAQIDKTLWYYAKYPLLFLVFVGDYAFSEKEPGARSLAYGLYHTGINEPLKAASIRIRFFLFIYFFVAGTLLSNGLINGA